LVLLVYSMVEEDDGWLPSAPLDMEYDNSRMERFTASYSSKHANTPTYPFNVRTLVLTSMRGTDCVAIRYAVSL